MTDIFGKIAEIKSILSDDFKNMQSFESFRDWKLNELVKFDNGVEVTKLIDSKTHMRFLTMIPCRVSFKEHWHDCIEVCSVVSGFLSDKLKKRSAKINEKIAYSIGEQHEPFNPSYSEICVLTVDFYK
jgi:anti-sigma factor ChrR (cupin superfamily)